MIEQDEPVPWDGVMNSWAWDVFLRYLHVVLDCITTNVWIGFLAIYTGDETILRQILNVWFIF